MYAIIVVIRFGNPSCDNFHKKDQQTTKTVDEIVRPQLPFGWCPSYSCEYYYCMFWMAPHQPCSAEIWMRPHLPKNRKSYSSLASPSLHIYAFIYIYRFKGGRT